MEVRARKLSDRTLKKIGQEEKTRVITKERSKPAPAKQAQKPQVDLANLISALANSHKLIVEAINSLDMSPAIEVHPAAPPEIKIPPQEKVKTIHAKNIKRDARNRISSADFDVIYKE